MWSLIKKRKWWLIGTLGLLIAGLILYRRWSQPAVTYTTVQPQIRDLKQTLDISGVIDAHEKATLTFPVASRLSWVGVKEGDRVKKWQAIASVDTRTLQKQLQLDLNNFGKEFRDHDQTLDDYNYYGNPSIDRELRRILENAQFDLDNSVLAVEIRDLAIKLSSIVSPINGIVTQLDKPFSGVTVLPTDTFQIVNPDSIYFRVIVDEEDIGLVNLNQPATITLDAYPKDTYSSVVSFVDFNASATEGGGTGYAIDLTLPVDNQQMRYKLGMNGEVEIILEEKSSALSVPVDSLISREGKDYVEVDRQGKLEKLEVVTGIDDGDYIEIISGVSQADLIVIPSNGKD